MTPSPQSATTPTPSRAPQAPTAGGAPRGPRPTAGRLGAYGAGLLLAVGLGAVALSSGHAAYPADPGGAPAGTAYSRSLPALGGQTLAAYVAQHQEARLPRIVG